MKLYLDFNRKQKVLAWLTFVIVALILFTPPWSESIRNGNVKLVKFHDFQPVFDPPNYEYVEIAWSILFLELLFVGWVSSGLILLFRTRKKIDVS